MGEGIFFKGVYLRESIRARWEDYSEYLLVMLAQHPWPLLMIVVLPSFPFSDPPTLTLSPCGSDHVVDHTS